MKSTGVTKFKVRATRASIATELEIKVNGRNQITPRQQRGEEKTPYLPRWKFLQSSCRRLIVGSGEVDPTRALELKL